MLYKAFILSQGGREVSLLPQVLPDVDPLEEHNAYNAAERVAQHIDDVSMATGDEEMLHQLHKDSEHSGKEEGIPDRVVLELKKRKLL